MKVVEPKGRCMRQLRRRKIFDALPENLTNQPSASETVGRSRLAKKVAKPVQRPMAEGTRATVSADSQAPQVDLQIQENDENVTMVDLIGNQAEVPDDPLPVQDPGQVGFNDDNGQIAGIDVTRQHRDTQAANEVEAAAIEPNEATEAMEVEEETEQFPHQEEELPLPVAPLVALENAQLPDAVVGGEENLPEEEDPMQQPEEGLPVAPPLQVAVAQSISATEPFHTKSGRRVVPPQLYTATLSAQQPAKTRTPKRNLPRRSAEPSTSLDNSTVAGVVVHEASIQVDLNEDVPPEVHDAVVVPDIQMERILEAVDERFNLTALNQNVDALMGQMVETTTQMAGMTTQIAEMTTQMAELTKKVGDLAGQVTLLLARNN